VEVFFGINIAFKRVAIGILTMNNTKSRSIAKKSNTTFLRDKAVPKALDLMEDGDHTQALTLLDVLNKRYPDQYLVCLNRGICLFHLRRYQEAAKQFYAVYLKVPKDYRVLQLCGESHLAAGYFDMAIQFCKRCAKANPDDVSNWTNLSIAAGKSGQLVEATMYATQALSLAPTAANSYVNLGTTLLALTRLDEAEQAYQTALAIDPTNQTALGNLATVYEKRGEYELSCEQYDRAYSMMDANSQEAKELLYRSSYAFLGAGILREGWRRYEYGFYSNDRTSRYPKRRFAVPQWRGEPLGCDKCLLVWGEQGLGDELAFYGLLNEVQNRCQSVAVECEPRLVSMLQRSFPEMLVRATDLKKPSVQYEYDFHVPAGSLMGIFRNEISDFKKFKPYIKPDPQLENEFHTRLMPFREKKLVGICWRSGKTDARRNQNYLPLGDLSQLLCIPDLTFVNLQYGDCERELAAAEEAFNIKILRWHDIDLKNDQEALAALINNLDAVISAGTAVAPMALAVGAPLLWFGLRGWTWFGQEEYPWAGNMEYIAPENNQQLRSIVPKLSQALENLLDQRAGDIEK
jgi:tetratricopeptide (TPR) repeat protein